MIHKTVAMLTYCSHLQYQIHVYLNLFHLLMRTISFVLSKDPDQTASLSCLIRVSTEQKFCRVKIFYSIFTQCSQSWICIVCLVRCQNILWVIISFLARLDKVHEELLYYPRRRRQCRHKQNVKVFTLKFFM